MKLKIPEFENKQELYKYLKENKADLMYQKKESIKFADSVLFSAIPLQHKSINIDKSIGGVEPPGVIKRRAIINTTKILDSHGDVHIDGIWDKTVKENTRMKHLQEHRMEFDKVISDKEDLKATTQTYSWKDLGVDAEGETEALVFDSTIKEERNSFMYKAYLKGDVDNHSVGMRYVKLAMAIDSDDEDYKEEKAEWDKHIDSIVNRDEAEAKGYFWPVYEAKAIEGSAVLMGSNPITPTLEPKSFTQEEKPAAIDPIQLERFKKIINS